MKQYLLDLIQSIEDEEVIEYLVVFIETIKCRWMEDK